MIDLKKLPWGLSRLFSDGGSYTTVDVAYQHALHLLEAGPIF